MLSIFLPRDILHSLDIDETERLSGQPRKFTPALQFGYGPFAVCTNSSGTPGAAAGLVN